jgi:hypothetical protein
MHACCVYFVPFVLATEPNTVEFTLHACFSHSQLVNSQDSVCSVSAVSVSSVCSVRQRVQQHLQCPAACSSVCSVSQRVQQCTVSVNVYNSTCSASQRVQRHLQCQTTYSSVRSISQCVQQCTGPASVYNRVQYQSACTVSISVYSRGQYQLVWAMPVSVYSSVYSSVYRVSAVHDHRRRSAATRSVWSVSPARLHQRVESTQAVSKYAARGSVHDECNILAGAAKPAAPQDTVSRDHSTTWIQGPIHPRRHAALPAQAGTPDHTPAQQASMPTSIDSAQLDTAQPPRPRPASVTAATAASATAATSSPVTAGGSLSASRVTVVPVAYDNCILCNRQLQRIEGGQQQFCTSQDCSLRLSRLPQATHLPATLDIHKQWNASSRDPMLVCSVLWAMSRQQLRIPARFVQTIGGGWQQRRDLRLSGCLHEHQFHSLAADTVRVRFRSPVAKQRIYYYTSTAVHIRKRRQFSS